MKRVFSRVAWRNGGRGRDNDEPWRNQHRSWCVGRVADAEFCPYPGMPGSPTSPEQPSYGASPGQPGSPTYSPNAAPTLAEKPGDVDQPEHRIFGVGP